MNPIINHFADASVLYAGLGLTMATEATVTALREQPWRTVLAAACLAGVATVWLSATPLPRWLLVLWTALAAAPPLLAALAARWRLAALAAALLASGALLAAELPWHRMPKLAAAEGSTIYVVGDSISAGVGDGLRRWPRLLGEALDARVVNLARAGALAAEGQEQAAKIPPGEALVIVELGGNDLLGGRPAERFERDFDALCARLSRDGHRLLIMELPLAPSRTHYGRAQRRIARRYGAAMLPKRVFAEILTAPGATLDGLHLSQQGHQAMADALAPLFR